MTTISIASMNCHPYQFILIRLGSDLLFYLAFVRDECVLHVGGHVQAEGKGEMGVHLLLHHGDHVKAVPHGVKCKNIGQGFEASTFLSPYFGAALGAGVHVVAFQHVLHTHLLQTLVEAPHLCHLAPDRVELLRGGAHVPTVKTDHIV